MRFPGAASGAGQLMPVQESGKVLDAVIKSIEPVVPREVTPYLIGMAVGASR